MASRLAGLRGNDKKAPNIFHIILDEYQADMFSMSLDPEIRKKLGGFVIFPEAVTVFRRTEMSFATIFSGKNYDIKSPPLGYQKAAFNTEDSFLFWLKKKAGYRTSAVMHPVFNFKSKGFDSVAFHKEVLQLDYAAVNLVFRKLSFFSNYPALVAEKIIGRDDFEQMNNQNLLPVFAPSNLIKAP